MRNALLLFLQLILSAPLISLADTRILGDDDMFCEASLEQAIGTLDEVFKDLTNVLPDTDRGRLARAHGEWMSARDANCAFAAAGNVDRLCCLQRETENRIGALYLFLAQYQPLSLYSWKTRVRVSEKGLLEEHIKGRTRAYANPVWPDEFLRIADSQYLLTFASVPAAERRLEYVNLRRGISRKIIEGEPKLVRVLRDRGENKNVLVKISILDRLIQWREYYLIRLSRSEKDLLADHVKLAMFWEDSKAGRCDQHSAEFLRLKNAVIPRRIEFVDVNKDGFGDIVFNALEIECQTQKTTEYQMVFLAEAEGFSQLQRPDR